MELDESTLSYIEATRKKHEFLSFLILPKDIKVGIIQNATAKLVMFYDFEKIDNEYSKRLFLEYGDDWWWQSNLSVPIDSFIGVRFEEFAPVLIGYPKKGIDRIIGPCFSLSELYLKKRIKKKRVDLLSHSDSD